jgi:YggT family protein
MIILAPIFKLLITVANIYTFFLTGWIILKLLIHFGVVNASHSFVRVVMNFLDHLIEPLLHKIRKVVPFFGSIDLSPLVLYLLVEFLKNMFIYGIIAVSS